MQLFIISIFIVLGIGLISLNPQVSVAKHEESNSDKSKSDSNNQATTTPTDNKQSDVIPIEPPIPTPPIAPVAPIQCDEANAKPECANTVIAQTSQVRSEQTQDKLQPCTKSDSSQTLTEKDSNNNGGGGSNTDNSGSGSSDSSSNEESTNEEQKLFSTENHDNLGSESRFIIMQQDNGQVGLFQIISNEDNMSVNILPKTIRPLESFDTASEALQWINKYDNR